MKPAIPFRHMRLWPTHLANASRLRQERLHRVRAGAGRLTGHRYDRTGDRLPLEDTEAESPTGRDRIKAHADACRRAITDAKAGQDRAS